MTPAKKAKIEELQKRALETLCYHRKPTMSEITFGHGATHYADMPLDICVSDDGKIKQKLKSPLDGLWYIRS